MLLLYVFLLSIIVCFLPYIAIIKPKIVSVYIFIFGSTIYTIPLVDFLLQNVLDSWGGLSGNTSLRMIFFGAAFCLLGAVLTLIESRIREMQRKYLLLCSIELVWTAGAILLLYLISAYV